MPKQRYSCWSEQDKILSVVLPVERKLDPRTPVDYSDISSGTPQSKTPTLNNQSDKNDKFIKENIENAQDTASKFRKPNECNIDKKEDTIPSWEDLEVIDSFQADDESLSRHNDLSEGKIESDNDVSMSKMFRNNCFVNRDEEFPLKSDDLSTEKMKKSKNDAMKQTQPLNYNNGERNYKQGTDATWSQCNSTSRRQKKRKYTKSSDDSRSSDRRKCRSMGSEERHKLDQMSKGNSRIVKCNNTCNAQINCHKEAACHGVKEPPKVSDFPGQQYRHVQCMPALTSGNDGLKNRRKRKYSDPSIKLSSRGLSPHSPRKKQESRNNKRASWHAEVFQHDSYNSKHDNACEEQRHSGNAITREGVPEQRSLSSYREFGSQFNRHKEQLQMQLDNDSRHTTQRFKDYNIKSSTMANSHTMARNNRPINAVVTYKPSELPSDYGYRLISVDANSNDDYKDSRMYQSSIRNNGDRSVRLNPTSPERNPHNRSNEYQDTLPDRIDALPSYSHTGESWNSRTNNCDRSDWLTQTSTERKPHNTSSHYRDVSIQPSNCTLPNSYNTCESWDLHKIHASNKHGKNVERNHNISICERFTTNPNNKHECSDLHICKYFLLSNCRQSGCMFGHNLRDQHNSNVLKCHNLQTYDDEMLKEIIRQIDNRNVSTIPLVCKFYNNEGGCAKGDRCNHLHICKYYINENCKFNDTCKRSHDFADDQPIHILTMHGLFTLDVRILRSLLMKTLQNGEVKLKRNISKSSFQQGLQDNK